MINRKLLLVLTIITALTGASVSFSLIISGNGIPVNDPPIAVDNITEEVISSTILERDEQETIGTNISEDDMGAALLEKLREDANGTDSSVDTTEITESDADANTPVATEDDTLIDEVANDETITDNEVIDGNEAITDDNTTDTTADNDTQTETKKDKKKKKGNDGPGTPIAKFTIETQGTIVRSGPNADHPEIGSLPIGTTGEVIENVNDYWVKINFNGDVGYIYSGYSKIEDL